jgi:hypothetical protein
MLPKIVLIGTGGTIASRYDHKLGRTALQRRIGHLGERDTCGCRAALASILDGGQPD